MESQSQSTAEWTEWYAEKLKKDAKQYDTPFFRGYRIRETGVFDKFKIREKIASRLETLELHLEIDFGKDSETMKRYKRVLALLHAGILWIDACMKRASNPRVPNGEIGSVFLCVRKAREVSNALYYDAVRILCRKSPRFTTGKEWYLADVARLSRSQKHADV